MHIKAIWFAVALLIFSPLAVKAYSVLTHEAIIDASWDVAIEPMLKKKFPDATDEDLKNARAYAYGGAIVPDMGYYPFGSVFFTDLIHYVRSGDFIDTLIKEAQDLNEYAFAIGVLCHYNADKYGHALGINVSVPLIYPDMKVKFGDVVTYAEDHVSHIRTEFGFDVVQTARANYAPNAYHKFIGFEIARPVLERAFKKTYGLDINDVFGNLSLAISTFRWSVKNLFPEMTKAAWASKKSEIQKTNPAVTRKSYIYKLRRADYHKEFGKDRTKPGFFAGILSFIIKISPKIGPLKALKFKPPGVDAENLFVKSFDTVIVKYSGNITELDANKLMLMNVDFDTGNKTALGEYSLTDKTYEELVIKLKEANFDLLTSDLQKNIIAFYESASALSTDGKDAKENENFASAFNALKGAPVIE